MFLWIFCDVVSAVCVWGLDELCTQVEIDTLLDQRFGLALGEPMFEPGLCSVLWMMSLEFAILFSLIDDQRLALRTFVW